jgi:hypothetical protein
MRKLRTGENQRTFATLGLETFYLHIFNPKTHIFLIYRNVILSGVIYKYGCETRSVILNEDYRLKVFSDRALRMIFGSNREETMEGRKKTT